MARTKGVLAVVEHDPARRDLHGGTARALVDQQRRARVAGLGKGVIERLRPIALTLIECEQACLRTRTRMRAPKFSSLDKQTRQSGHSPAEASESCARQRCETGRNL